MYEQELENKKSLVAGTKTSLEDCCTRILDGFHNLDADYEMSQEKKQSNKLDIERLCRELNVLKVRQDNVIKLVTSHDPAATPTTIAIYENNTRGYNLNLDELNCRLAII